MNSATYRVKVSHPDRGKAEDLIQGVSSEHAIKILLTAFLDVKSWPTEWATMFFYVGSRDLHRLVPGLTFEAQYLGRDAGVEA